MTSRFYQQGHHKKVAIRIKEYLDSQNRILSPQEVNSPRSVGAALESLIANRLESILGNWCKEYSADFARRSMADIAFTDIDNIYSIIDAKTHREDAAFSMPNLTSVERISRLYESDDTVFSLIIIKYSVDESSLSFSDVIFSPIECIDWRSLTIGALGWGQIQIANANDIRIVERHSRRSWMLQLCEVMMEFYPREIDKIRERIQRFETVRQYWENKEDTG